MNIYIAVQKFGVSVFSLKESKGAFTLVPVVHTWVRLDSLWTLISGSQVCTQEPHQSPPKEGGLWYSSCELQYGMSAIVLNCRSDVRVNKTVCLFEFDSLSWQAWLTHCKQREDLIFAVHHSRQVPLCAKALEAKTKGSKKMRATLSLHNHYLATWVCGCSLITQAERGLDPYNVQRS